MIVMAKTHRLFNSSGAQLLHENSMDKVIIFKRADLIFAFNFNPYQSFTDYRFEAPPGKYRMILDCDAPKYGGHGRLLPQQTHFTIVDNTEAKSQHMLSLYLPARSGFVLCPTIEDPQPWTFPKQRKREEQKPGIACNTADSLSMLLVKPRALREALSVSSFIISWNIIVIGTWKSGWVRSQLNETKNCLLLNGNWAVE